MNYKKYIEGTAQVLRDSQKSNKMYEVSFLGKNFKVYPKVFSPKYFFDTEIFARELPIMKGQKVLEIGSGTGAISIFAAYKGASHVVAIDINPSAVLNTKENIHLHKLESIVNVRQGDVYSSVTESEKFDVIFWNVPFGFVEYPVVSDLEKSVFDWEYKSIKRFIFGASKHLEKGGLLYIGFSDTLGKLNLLESFISDAGYIMEKIYSEKSKEVHPVTFDIYQAKLRK